MNTNTSFIASAVVFAGVLIAGAIIFVGGDSGNIPTASLSTESDTASSAYDMEAVRAVDPTEDHIRGELTASVSIIEFSDFECPFCQRFHPTAKRLVDDFAGQVNWVYRHFPLTTIHSRALSSAIASECVARLGGNDAFWAFADALFANQNRLGNDLYNEIAVNLGLSQDEFRACAEDDTIRQPVEDDFNEAVAAGARGTPFAVVVTANDRLIPFAGALPYEQVRAIIEQALIN